MTGNIEYPRREKAPMRSWTQAQRGVLKPVREGDTKACLSFQRGVEILTILSQTFLSELQPCAVAFLPCQSSGVGCIVVVAAAVDAEVVAVARARVVVREGGGTWGGLHGGGVCCLVVAVARLSPLQVVAADMGGDACGSETVVGRYEMAVWSGSRGVGSKCKFVGISIGVMAETDGAGATTEGAAVDREGMAVGNAGIVMMVGKAGAVMTADKVKMAIMCGAEAMAVTGDTEGVGAGRAEMGGCRGGGGCGREGWGMYGCRNGCNWE
ncbi:hypothetical protein F5148DRAFT_1155171 [Russula earlei]|uniref:Uncharacterized protein n=1 Tax=Russula earlei TaxID=71964 RepID=A0ACC0TQ80_9AGAM|nr:hypothetical protein F5148DRAFT_1155171 [Russula earlei]